MGRRGKRICLAVVAALALTGSSPEGVVLSLDGVSAKPLVGSYVLFRCSLTLENRTGKVLKVRSHFFSAFDGMALVIQDAGGKELKKQPYNFHQSPMAEEREYSLPIGKTTTQIVFPVHDLPQGQTRFKVRVVGTLPGGGYGPQISSKVCEVQRMPE